MPLAVTQSSLTSLDTFFSSALYLGRGLAWAVAATAVLGSPQAPQPWCDSCSLLRALGLHLSVYHSQVLTLIWGCLGCVSTIFSHTCVAWNRRVPRSGVLTMVLSSPGPGMMVVDEKCSSWMFAFRTPAKSCFAWYHWCKHQAMRVIGEWFIYLFWVVECQTTERFLKFYNLVVAWSAV